MPFLEAEAFYLINTSSVRYRHIHRAFACDIWVQGGVSDVDSACNTSSTRYQWPSNKHSNFSAQQHDVGSQAKRPTDSTSEFKSPQEITS